MSLLALFYLCWGKISEYIQCSLNRLFSKELFVKWQAKGKKNIINLKLRNLQIPMWTPRLENLLAKDLFCYLLDSEYRMVCPFFLRNFLAFLKSTKKRFNECKLKSVMILRGLRLRWTISYLWRFSTALIWSK